MTVEQLDRETTVGIAQLNSLLHDLLGGFAGKDNLGAQGVKKADEQWGVIIYYERSGDANRRFALTFPVFFK